MIKNKKEIGVIVVVLLLPCPIIADIFFVRFKRFTSRIRGELRGSGRFVFPWGCSTLVRGRVSFRGWRGSFRKKAMF